MFSVGGMGPRRGGIASVARIAQAVLCSALLSACADNLSTPRQATTMPTGPATGQPIGAMLFCNSHASECAGDAAPEVRVTLTDEAWHELRSVQYNVDNDIAPRNPTMVAWDYASNGTGSCVQYAMEKRRALLALGWPASSLRLATATTRGGVGHLVLIANTTGGDLVLDNLSRDVMPWQSLSYRWGAVQTDASMRKWAVAAAPGGVDTVGDIVVALGGTVPATAVQTSQAPVPATPPVQTSQAPLPATPDSPSLVLPVQTSELPSPEPVALPAVQPSPVPNQLTGNPPLQLSARNVMRPVQLADSASH
jgi:predicted transglutaminase-like cysteine proteinase